MKPNEDDLYCNVSKISNQMYSKLVFSIPTKSVLYLKFPSHQKYRCVPNLSIKKKRFCPEKLLHYTFHVSIFTFLGSHSL